MDVCPICELAAEIGHPGADKVQVNCPRCGHYEVTRTAKVSIGKLGRMQSARLSHAVRCRAEGDTWPLLTSDQLDLWSKEPLPKTKVQLARLLHWFGEQVGDDRFQAIELVGDHLAGYLGAVDGDGANVIVMAADNANLIEHVSDDHYSLTLQGWELLDSADEEDEAVAVGVTSKVVFIGHGRSPVWRDLKDYLQERLGLEWNEFNRQPAAGIPTSGRLEEMLSSAGFAFIVMTGEDQSAAGSMNPRLNVVHEAGLFQGKLGFRKAIVLLEEGCEEFSNIVGLGQIRFPVGNINAVRDEIRQVLEREGLVQP